MIGGEEHVYERVNLTTAQFSGDIRPLAVDCLCQACTSGLSRAWFWHAFRAGETLAMRLATIHNLAFIQGIMVELRAELE